jgi:hypothetical protein
LSSLTSCLIKFTILDYPLYEHNLLIRQGNLTNYSIFIYYSNVYFIWYLFITLPFSCNGKIQDSDSWECLVSSLSFSLASSLSFTRQVKRELSLTSEWKERITSQHYKWQQYEVVSLCYEGHSISSGIGPITFLSFILKWWNFVWVSNNYFATNRRRKRSRATYFVTYIWRHLNVAQASWQR